MLPFFKQNGLNFFEAKHFFLSATSLIFQLSSYQAVLLNIECSIIWQFPWIKIMNNLVNQARDFSQPGENNLAEVGQ